MGPRQWSSQFFRNLFRDGRLPSTDRGFLDSAMYQRARDWIDERDLAFAAIVAIKLMHTAIFVVIMSLIVHVAYAGVRNRVSRWTLAALSIAVGEGVLLGINGGRCPLTVMVEDLGSAHGSVSDIFLPNLVARHIPHISGALLGIGLIALAIHRLGRR